MKVLYLQKKAKQSHKVQPFEATALFLHVTAMKGFVTWPIWVYLSL